MSLEESPIKVTEAEVVEFPEVPDFTLPSSIEEQKCAVLLYVSTAITYSLLICFTTIAYKISPVQ